MLSSEIFSKAQKRSFFEHAQHFYLFIFPKTVWKEIYLFTYLLILNNTIASQHVLLSELGLVNGILISALLLASCIVSCIATGLCMNLTSFQYKLVLETQK